MYTYPLQWRHNDHNGFSNHQPHGCLLNRLFRRRSEKTSKLRVTGLCAGTGEFPAQRASNAENASTWWRHYIGCLSITSSPQLPRLWCRTTWLAAWSMFKNWMLWIDFCSCWLARLICKFYFGLIPLILLKRHIIDLLRRRNFTYKWFQ